MAFQPDQWPAFEDEALARLNRREEHATLRLWHYPSFGVHRSWSVCKDVIHSLRWDRPRDIKLRSDPLEGIRRGHTTQPSLERKSIPLTQDRYDQLLHSLTLIQIPLLTQRTICLDGESCGLELYGHFRLQWDSAWDEDWEPLVAWMDTTVAWLERAGA